MTGFSNSIGFLRRAALIVSAVAMLCAALFAAAAARPDEPSTDSVGVIDGEAIAVTGPMHVETLNGQVKTVLRSGSDIRVKSGTARIDLVEGGQITICGPAHLSVNSVSNTSSSTTFANSIGGGVDWNISGPVAWRFQGDYIHTSFYGGAQNNLRLSTGIVFRF